MDPSGKRALLTGATGGLGRAIAEALAERGARLVLSGRDEAQLTEFAAGLAGEGHRALPADLALEGEPDRLAAEAGEVDVLIANAGLGGRSAVESGDVETVRTVARVNYEAPLVLTACLLPGMRERGSGSLVFISSLAGKAIPLKSALYASSKAGVRAFALGLAGDLAGSGVSASSINPGFVRDAGMFHDSGRRPPPALGTATPTDVAGAVLEAIETGRREIDVAPFLQRRFVSAAYHFHAPLKALERRMG